MDRLTQLRALSPAPLIEELGLSASVAQQVIDEFSMALAELGGMIPSDQWREGANVLKNDPMAVVEIAAAMPIDTAPPAGVPVSRRAAILTSPQLHLPALSRRLPTIS